MRRMQPRDAQIKLNQLMALNAHTRSQQIYSLLSAGIARHKLSAFYFLSIYICLYFFSVVVVAKMVNGLRSHAMGNL